MPYMIAKNDGGEFCVFRKGEDGQPMGETLGCHPTQDEAGAQIGAIEQNENKTVKVVADTEQAFEIEGLAIPYIGPFQGNKDFDGERFTKATELCLDWFPQGRPVLYNHGRDAELALSPIGREVKNWDSPVGRWARVQIEKSRDYWRDIKRMVDDGKLFFSSGALGPYVTKDEGGDITRWPWVELTLTPTPANPYAVTMPAARKSYKALGLDINLPRESGEAAEPQKSEAAEPEAGGKEKTHETNLEDSHMDEKLIGETVAKAVQEAMDARDAAVLAAKAKADKEAADAEARKAEVDAAVKSALEARLADSKLAHPVGAEKSKWSGVDVVSKYDSLSNEDLDFLAVFTGKQRNGWSEKLRNVLADRVGQKGLVYAGSGSEDRDWNVAQKAIASMDLTDCANWVPTAWSSELWRKLRLENKVAGLFKSIEMPANTYELPTESTDPTIYVVAEATAGTPTLSTGITTSQSADTKVQLSCNKLGAAVWLSGELIEDNAFPIIPMVRDQMGRKMADAMEFVILSGDTCATAANVSDATPGATNKIMMDNGLRKYCLVTATAQGRNVGALDIDDFIGLRGLLGKGGVDPKNLVYIVDYETYIKKMMLLDDVLTVDKYGNSATILSGELAKVMGIPVIVSENLDKTGTNGKEISGGTTGNILCVVRDRWIIGYRRHLKFGQNYYDHEDRTRLTVLSRWCFAGFNETDGTDVSLGYNVTLT